MSLKVGEILVKQGLLRPDQLNLAIEDQKKTGNRLTTIILNMGFLKESQILRAMEKHYQVPGVDLSAFEIDPSVLSLVKKEICEKQGLIPVQKAGGTLVVAFSDPTNIMVKEDLRHLTRLKIQPVVSTTHSIVLAIERHFGGSLTMTSMGGAPGSDAGGDEYDEKISTAEMIDVDDSDEPVIKFVNQVLNDSIRKKVSDIHFEPYEKRYRIRFRIDGNLVEAAAPPGTMAPAISSRIKIMCKMDIAEKRRPQDGRLKVRTSKGREMDFRVSSMPTLWGEKIVMRLLDKSNLQLDMTKLGFEDEDLRLFKANINLPQGMVLITGPTGSGKTTTIYSALAELNKSDVNISTAEDPVEFNLEGINQVQVNPEIDLNFTVCLKSFLRQDPDIVMVGEIRDLETAEIAFKAASTGHLVVSTLHTNDAPSTVIRLTEMGVAPYLITSCVNLVVAQRLVGRNCENCKAPLSVMPQILVNLGVSADDVKDYNVMKGKGCATCNNTGIKGRLAIYEVLPMTEKIKDAVLKGATQGQLRYLARELGLRTLRRSALMKLKMGLTTVEEVLNSSVKDT